MLTDTQRVIVEPLVEQCPPVGKALPLELRRRFEVILLRHENRYQRRDTALH